MLSFNPMAQNILNTKVPALKFTKFSMIVVVFGVFFASSYILEHWYIKIASMVACIVSFCYLGFNIQNQVEILLDFFSAQLSEIVLSLHQSKQEILSSHQNSEDNSKKGDASQDTFTEAANVQSSSEYYNCPDISDYRVISTIQSVIYQLDMFKTLLSDLFELVPFILLLIVATILLLQDCIVILFAWLIVLFSFQILCRPNPKLFRYIIYLSVAIGFCLVFFKFGENAIYKRNLMYLVQTADAVIDLEKQNLKDLNHTFAIYQKNREFWIKEIYEKKKLSNETSYDFSKRIVKDVRKLEKFISTGENLLQLLQIILNK